MQLQQWLQRNPELTAKGSEQKLSEAAMKQPWDPSVQAMAVMPDVVKWLTDDIQWTTDLGNAFLAQQSDVMDAVQRMRAKAQQKGTLASNDKQKVENQTIENKTVVVIEQSDPEVVYVPSYDPMYAYGDIGYPYPPVYYPPWSGLIGFGSGLVLGAIWGNNHPGWGWGCGWGNNNININNNNVFNRNANINGGNRINAGNNWQHNPQHRGGTPYSNRKTADRFGGNARGDSLGNRQNNARDQIGRQGGRLDSGNRPTATPRDNAPRLSNQGNRDFGNQNLSNRGGGDRMGSRDLSRQSGSSSFGGGSRDFNGGSARSSSSRGMSSMGGSRGGGGFSRGGGGGFRGGGGRRR